jgi:alpha-L-rhamnosidase
MNSFNHYAYGAIGDFMYRQVAGIDTYESAPGYKKIRIRPHPGGFRFVTASLETGYGTASVHWEINGETLVLDAEIPANSSAGIWIPTPDAASITEGGRALAAAGLQAKASGETGYQLIETGSGKYHFVCRLK